MTVHKGVLRTVSYQLFFAGATSNRELSLISDRTATVGPSAISPIVLLKACLANTRAFNISHVPGQETGTIAPPLPTARACEKLSFAQTTSEKR